MDVNMDNPIVINSDDEDDDDVVLLKEEKAAGDVDKNLEDDVIFVPEKSPLPILKSIPENQKNKNSTRANAGGFFESAFSSMVNDISEPSEISQSMILTAETLPAGTKQSSTLMTLSQITPSILPVPELGIDTKDKPAYDAGTGSVKTLQECHLMSGNNVDDTLRSSTSVRLEKFTKFNSSKVDGVTSLSSQSMNTKLSKNNAVEDYMSFILADRNKVTTISGDLLDSSSTSSLACMNEPSSVNDRQNTSSKICVGNASQNNALWSSIVDTTLTQDINAKIPHDYIAPGFVPLNALTSPPCVSNELVKNSALELDSCLNYVDFVMPNSAAYSMTYFTDLEPEPRLDKAKLNAFQKTSLRTNSDSPLSLDCSNLYAEDFVSLFDAIASNESTKTLNDAGNKSPGISKYNQGESNEMIVSAFCNDTIIVSSKESTRHDIMVRTHLDEISHRSVSESLDVKEKKTDAVQWQIVSSTSKTSEVQADNLLGTFSERKKRKLMEDSMREKQSLKLRLKISSPTPVSMSNSRHPGMHLLCNKIGKKSVRECCTRIGETSKEKQVVLNIHSSVSENNLKEPKEENHDIQIMCVTCDMAVDGKKLSKCGRGHVICTTCLEPQVKVILTDNFKQKKITCPSSACSEVISFDELKKTLPSFVVDVLEAKLDKEYISYITNWMFTNEELKSRYEFATLDTEMAPCPAVSMKKFEEICSQKSHDFTEDLPTYWTPMERGAPVMAFEVVPDTEEYRALAFQFYETLSFGDFDIVKIMRIQNPILWKYFSLKQSDMIQENEGMDVEEKQLYHGTHRSALEAIARKGFDWRLSGKHGTVYGCGSYFAATACYSHAYTDCAGNGISVKASSGLGYMRQRIRRRRFIASTTCHHSQKATPFLSSSQQVAQPFFPFHSVGSSQSLQPPPAHTPHSTFLPGQPGFNNYNEYFGSSNVISTSTLYNTQPLSSQNQPSTIHTRNYNTDPSITNNASHIMSANVPAVALGDSLEDLLRNINSSSQNEPLAARNSIPEAKEHEPIIFQAHEKGTDLTSAFTRDPSSNSHFMFVARVLVGRQTTGKSGLKRPPPLDENDPYGKCYDSCVDNICSPQVHVIFDSNQSYPEYVIEYNSHTG